MSVSHVITLFSAVYRAEVLKLGHVVS